MPANREIGIEIGIAIEIVIPAQAEIQRVGRRLGRPADSHPRAGGDPAPRPFSSGFPPARE